MNKSLKIWSAVVGIGVAAVAGTVAVRMNRQPQYETVAVDRGPVVAEVSVTGSVSPETRIVLESEASGKVARVRAKEGETVKEGTVILEIDARDVQSRILSQKAAVAAARARLDELVSGATKEELAAAEAAVASAEGKEEAALSAESDARVAVANAETNYAAIVAKTEASLASKVQAALSDFNAAQTGAADAVNRLTLPLFTTDNLLTFSANDSAAENEARRTRPSAKEAVTAISAAVASVGAGSGSDAVIAAASSISGYLDAVKAHLDACALVLKSAIGLSSTTLTTYQQNVSTAQTSVNSSAQLVAADRTSIDLQRKLNDADVAAAQIALSNAKAALSSATSAVATAKDAVAQAKAQFDITRTGARSEVIAAQRAQVASAEATLSGLYTDLAKRQVVAPLDGVVTDIAVEVGESVLAGRAVATLDAAGQFEIISNVSEVDIAKVVVEQPVHITLDAFPGDEWTGKVLSVDPAENVVEGVIFYQVKVLFDALDGRIKSGMTANLDIEIGRRENVLRIPIRGLKEKAGKKYVEVVEGGRAVPRDIEVGIENNTNVEALSGVAEGDVVVVGEIK